MMNMVFRAVLAFTLLISATVEAGGDVSFSMDEITLTCPGSGKWWKVSGAKSVNIGTSHSYTYTGNKDQYYCEYEEPGTKPKKYHFYIQGKACGSCIELDARVFAVVIVADVIGTAVVMAIVYKCSKKTPGKPQKKSKSRSREGDIPLDDCAASPYQALSSHTRSQDPYSVINRTG